MHLPIYLAQCSDAPAGIVDRIDWVNAVLVQSIVSIVIGAPLAIWTGVMLARWVSYDAAKMKASEILSRLATIPDAATRDDYAKAVEQVISELLMVKAEMIRLKQVATVQMVQFVTIRLMQHAWLPRRPDGGPDVPAFPLKEGERQIMLTRLQPYGMAYPHMIFDAAPSLWQLIAVRRRVTSRTIFPACDYNALLGVEAAAIRQIDQQMAERQRQAAEAQQQAQNNRTL